MIIKLFKNKPVLLFLIFLLAFFLRFALLSNYPPGLYSDEAALGYNAYSILKTGRDEFGKLFPVTLQSFGDYKPPLSSYLMIPSIALFGLNEFSVRFPFACLGSLSIILIYNLSLKIFEGQKHKKLISLVAALFLAISPWHLHQSRSAMLVGIEVFFNALGILLFLHGLKRSFFLLLSSLSFSLAVYAYYGSRITAPLIIVSLLIVFKKDFFSSKKLKTNLISFLAGFLILIPLFIAIYKDPETLLGRAKFMSIFYDKNVWGQLWQARTLDGPNFPTVLTRIFHNKPFYYARDILRRWLEHFNLGFLFLKGDEIAPFQIPNMGVLYLIDLPFIVIGILSLIKNKNRNFLFLSLWFLLSPLVASLTFMTPAANRSFNLVFPIILITAFGVVTFFSQKMFNKYWLVGISVIYLLSFTYYLYQYYHNIPYQIPQKWNYGRKELISKLVKLQDNYQKVILTNRGGPPYIFLLFYQKYCPQKYWQTMRVNPYINELGWGHIDGFDKYEIPREFIWKNVEKEEGILYVSFEDQVPDIWQEPAGERQLKIRILDKVYYPNGQTVFKIFDLIPAKNG